MERYLVFDATCAICSQIAEVVRQVADGKVEAVGLHDPRARALLDGLYPSGWDPAPYLIVAGPGHPRAWAGRCAALRLAAMVGPCGAWRIWAAARRHGVSFPPPPAPRRGRGPTRRTFLKLVAGAAAALLGRAVRPAPVAACESCHSCGFRNVRTFRCVPSGGCWAGQRFVDYYDRYDALSGEYCYTYATGCCGQCCP